MRVGASGNWLFQNAYAVEEHPPTLLFLVYQGLGNITGIVQGSKVRMQTLAITFHVFRALAGVGFLASLYPVIALFVDSASWRRVAWLSIVVCGGLGWLLLLVTGQSLPLGSAPFDLYMGEVGTIVPLMAYPHTLLGRACVLAGITCFWRADQYGERHYIAVSSALWLVATIALPLEIVTAGGILMVWLIIRWIVGRKLPIRMAISAAVALLPGGLYNVLTLAMIGGSQVYASWNSQNLFPIPHPVHLISLYGLQSVAAISGLWVIWHGQDPTRELLTAWLIAPLILIFIPVSFQFRLIEGLYIPLLILAVIGVRQLKGWNRMIATLAGAMLVPSTLLVLLGSYALPMYLPDSVNNAPDDVAFERWVLDNIPDGSVILASPDLGLKLPAMAPVRVVIGHGFETPDFDLKEDLVYKFYRAELTPLQIEQFLNTTGADYVVLGPDELTLVCAEAQCTTDVSLAIGALPLKEVKRLGPYIIYEVAK
jgi:hypothetical protein